MIDQELIRAAAKRINERKAAVVNVSREEVEQGAVLLDDTYQRRLWLGIDVDLEALAGWSEGTARNQATTLAVYGPPAVMPVLRGSWLDGVLFGLTLAELEATRKAAE